jgi:hypothetical protein
VKAGVATLTVSGTGMYTGTLTERFTIRPKEVDVPESDITYNDNGTVSIKVPAIASESIEKIEANHDYELVLDKDYYVQDEYLVLSKDFLDRKSYKYTSLELNFIVSTRNYDYYIEDVKANSITGVSMSFKKKFVYDGKQKTPNIRLEGAVKGTDYTVKFAKTKRKAIGTYKFTVKGKSPKFGTRTGSFTIVPKRPAKIKTAKRTKSKATVKWTKVANCSGYQVQLVKITYILDTDGDDTLTRVYKSKMRKGKKSLSAVFKSVKKAKYNWARVRAYKTVNGKKIFSNWKMRKF